jgi:aryl-alcohol dehydrogenase-like predicted oxidoreductase
VELRNFGTTGLRVSALGLGAMHIADASLSEAEAGALLNGALDLGCTLIDTARSYGLSEERIGRHLAHRRDEFVLSTKLGYGVDGVPDWSYDCIVQGVERALRVLRTDTIDIAHLHSCPLEMLQRGDVVRALQDCHAAGKVRAAAYSGDNAALTFAIESGAFDSMQASLSVCDQAVLAHSLPTARSRGLGFIAKRPLAGAVWRHGQAPDDHAEGHYWRRWQAMGLSQLLDSQDPGALALRFAAHEPGVSSAIVGTSKLAHLRANIAAVEQGPLPPQLHDLLRQAFSPWQSQWDAMI